jgi:hypothetical protein
MQLFMHTGFEGNILGCKWRDMLPYLAALPLGVSDKLETRMHNYKRWFGLATVVFALLGGLPQRALAWGHQGHMVVGALADQLLTDRARAGLQADLGLTLEQAAPWGRLCEKRGFWTQRLYLCCRRAMAVTCLHSL